MSAGVGDPNGWVTNPPQTFVKVMNTSRNEMNGKLGLVLQWSQQRERYVVHTTIEQNQISLKSENLVKASWMESMQAQYELLTNDPRVREQVFNFAQKCESITGLSLQYLIICLGLVLVLSLYFLGINKTFMTLTMIIFMSVIILPDALSGATWPVIVSNIPMRLKAFLREQVPFGLGNQIASNDYYTYGFVGMIFAFYLFSMFATPGSRRSSSNTSTNTYPMPSAPPMIMTEDTRNRVIHLLKEQQHAFYKLGYDDKSYNRASGASIPDDMDLDVMNLVDAIYKEQKTVSFYDLGYEDRKFNRESGASLSDDMKQRLSDTTIKNNMAAYDEFYDDAPRGVTPPPADATASSSSSSESSWVKNIGTAGSVFYIYRTLNDLARDPITGQFNLQSIQTNFTSMDTWKIGMLGFVTYRLVTQIFF